MNIWQTHSIVLTIFVIAGIWAFIGFICLLLDWHYNRKVWKHTKEPIKEALGHIAFWPIWIYYTCKYGA